MHVLGAVQVSATYENQSEQFGSTGRWGDWLSIIRLDWPRIHYASHSDLQVILNKYEEVLGTFKGRKA